MKVNTAELKTHLGRYLQMVRKGETVEITSHAHPVARIVPYSDRGDLTLVKPTRNIQELKSIKSVKTKKHADGVGTLIEDRGKR